MYARAVDDAAERLTALRREEWENLALAGLALVLAVAAAEIRPALALPLFLGGLVVGALGVRALWRRWDLVERLACDRDAYVISEVRAYAARETTLERRRTFASLIRCIARQPGELLEPRVTAAAAQLEALAAELEDEALDLDPVAAVACHRLLSDVATSPLLNAAVPPEDLCSRICRIRSGFDSPSPPSGC